MCLHIIGNEMETQLKNKLYPVQLWLTSTIVIAPLLLVVIGLINDVKNSGLETIPLFMMFGLVLSIPVFLICLFAYRLLLQKDSSAILIKIVLAIITIVGVFITFIIISGSMAYMLSLVYSSSVIISSLFYRISEH